MMRAAVYTEIERQHVNREGDADFVIVAVSKQKVPDKGAFLLNHRQRYDFELQQIEEKMARILAVKNGSFAPKRCGVCGVFLKIGFYAIIKAFPTLGPRRTAHALH